MSVWAGQGCLPESISWNIATHKSWNPNELGFQGWNGTQSSLGIRQKQQQILDSLPSATKFITNSRNECLRLHGIAYIIMEFKSSDKTREILKISIGIFWFQGGREGGQTVGQSVSQSVGPRTGIGTREFVSVQTDADGRGRRREARRALSNLLLPLTSLQSRDEMRVGRANRVPRNLERL